MSPLEILMMDDEADSLANHLRPEQRLELFESWWAELSREEQKELANADS